jgi:hypothetical protein
MRKMKFFTAIVAAMLLWAVTAESAPRMTLPESSFNFGFVPQNSTVSHVFWLHSTGDDTLRVLNVKPG